MRLEDLHTAEEIHRRDMAGNREYRWRYRLGWLPGTFSIWWLKLRVKLHDVTCR